MPTGDQAVTQTAAVYTDRSDAAEAGRHLGDQVREMLGEQPPDALIVFASSQFDYERLLEALSAACRPALLVGSSSAGEFTGMRRGEGTACAMAIRSTDIVFAAGLGRGVGSDRSKAAGDRRVGVSRHHGRKGVPVSGGARHDRRPGRPCRRSGRGADAADFRALPVRGRWRRRRREVLADARVLRDRRLHRRGGGARDAVHQADRHRRRPRLDARRRRPARDRGARDAPRQPQRDAGDRGVRRACRGDGTDARSGCPAAVLPAQHPGHRHRSGPSAARAAVGERRRVGAVRRRDSRRALACTS